MTEIQISQEIFISFAGTLLALLSAGFVWLLKSAFSKHESEIMALARYERCLVINIEILNDNFDFLNRWLNSIKNRNRPYTAHFEQYLIDDSEHYKISDLELINQIIYLNYKLRRTAADFNHLQTGYSETLSEINSIPDEESKWRNLDNFHKNYTPGLEGMATNHDHLKKEILKTVARIRLVSKVRRYSLFSCLTLLFKDIWPLATKAKFDKELKQLHKEVAERENTNFMIEKDLQK